MECEGGEEVENYGQVSPDDVLLQCNFTYFFYLIYYYKIPSWILINLFFSYSKIVKETGG